MSVTLDLSGNDLVVNSIQSGSANTGGSGQLIPAYEYVQTGTLGASSASQTIWVNPNVGGTYKVVGATATQGTASSSGTVQIEVATGTQAIASGTNQLSSALSVAGTANTPVNATIVASPTTIAAGSRINVILGGTLTSLANCVVTVAIQRIS